MSRKSSTENNIHAIHNFNTFLKVKPAFEINKILRNRKEHKQKEEQH